MKLNLKKAEKAVFIERINRFVIRVLRKDIPTDVYLPNPGRLWELLLPGTIVYILPSIRQTKLPYVAIAVEKKNIPIMIHTHYTNNIIEKLIRNRRIKELSNYDIAKKEVKFGKSRIDFLLENGNNHLLLEVKTCTLFGNKLAMFPDAETTRGRRHLLELKKQNSKDLKGGVLFVIQWPYAKYFMPEFHVDIEFSKTLINVKDSIFVKAISIQYVENSLNVDHVRNVEIPWSIIPKYLKNTGCYMLILEISKRNTIEMRTLGRLTIEPGYYIYVGRAKRNLKQRIAYHKRRAKKFHWHIDYLTNISKKIQALPIRLPDAPECEIASKLSKYFKPIDGFGSTDCPCKSHLFYSSENPLRKPEFINTLMYFRIYRIERTLP